MEFAEKSAPPQASAEVHSLFKSVVEEYPPKMKEALSHMPNFSLESQTVPFREEYRQGRAPALLLLAAVGIVLLIGCAALARERNPA